MRWLLDECVDASLVEQLRRAGHDVQYVGDISPRATDAEVMSHAASEDRLLLTEDKDFGDLVFRQGRPVPGVVLLRVGAMQSHRKGERLDAAVERFGADLRGHYTVVEEARLRRRPLRSP